MWDLCGRRLLAINREAAVVRNSYVADRVASAVAVSRQRELRHGGWRVDREEKIDPHAGDTFKFWLWESVATVEAVIVSEANRQNNQRGLKTAREWIFGRLERR